MVTTWRDPSNPSLLTSEEIKRLTAYAAAVVNRMLPKFHVSHPPRPEDLVQTAILKVLNADRGVKTGDVEIVNGRAQLTAIAKADPVKLESYRAGLRLWIREHHDLEGFLKLVVLSDIRALFKKAENQTVDALGDRIQCTAADGMSPEVDADERLTLETFIGTLESTEDRQIATRILVRGATIDDLTFDLGLTRSQVEKRVRKLRDLAMDFAEPAH